MASADTDSHGNKLHYDKNQSKLLETPENEVEVKHDHLITELESSEGHTASTLR